MILSKKPTPKRLRKHQLKGMYKRWMPLDPGM
jgi:hypothetical protein